MLRFITPCLTLACLAACQPNPGPQNPPDKPLVACTQEAKLCPDGSAVGRTGPTCEFSPCPDKPAPR